MIFMKTVTITPTVHAKLQLLIEVIGITYLSSISTLKHAVSCSHVAFSIDPTLHLAGSIMGNCIYSLSLQC